MALDHNPVPKDPLTSNPNRNLSTAFPFAGDSSPADESDIRKVKLLCSFGGKILPRPSDGTLRYAGGDTRIIAVRRDTTLPELWRKMEDVYGAPVAIRYQLPEEDLDALVSVSSVEDLENMMEECDKLAEGGGSAKLRVFLFSQAEIASILADNFSAGPAVFDRYDGEQKYVEAVNSCSRSSTQNSDAGIDGSSNIEGSSPPAIVSPVSVASASFDRSILGTAATSVPLQEAYVALNPSQVALYSSQAFVEPHQVHYIPPHSLNMASAPRMVNVVSTPQHTYPPSMLIPPSSMPAQAGNVKPVKGKLDPLSDVDPNLKVFQRPLSQIPPLQPSNLPPPSIEPYGLHPVPPLTQGAVLRFEDCQMCQKALPHVHSDRVVNELGNASGVHVAKNQPKVQSYFSDDVARLQDHHSIVSMAMMENSVEHKLKHAVNPSHCGTYGVNKFPDSVPDREQIFGSIAENIDHSTLRQPLGPLGLYEDTQASYGVFVSSPQSHLENSFPQQQKQILNGDNFHAAKVFHPIVTFSLSNSVHASNDVSFSPLQTYHVDSLQQQNVLFAEGGDHIQVLHPSGTVGLSSTDQASYGMSVKPPQLHHVDSLWKQQVLAGTIPPFFPANQAVTGKQCSNDSSLINNISYDVLEPLSHAQGYVKQADGIIDDLNVSTFDILRSRDQLKPTVLPNVGIPVGMQTKNLSEVEDNNTFKLQNDANALLSSNAFITAMVEPVNPVFLNTDISNEIRLGSSSVIGEDSNTVMSHLGGSKLPSSNAFINTGLLPKENSVVPTNPLLSTIMELHPSELANTFQASTISGSCVLHAQNFERGVRPIPASQQISGLFPYNDDSVYTDSIAEGTSRIWKDEVSQVQNLFDGMAASRRGNAPFPLPCLMVPGQGEQFQETFVPGSLLENENPQEIIGSMNAYPPGSTIFASGEPIENLLPKRWSPDIAVLLEEGALHPPVDCLIKESRPDPVIDFGADYIDKDLHDLAEQVGELVLQSSPPGSVLSSSEPKELSPTFMQYHNSSENHLPEGQSTDIAVLLEEGALQPPLDWLIKESSPDSIVGMKDSGLDYINQDLHDLAEQVVESVLESSMPPLSVISFSGPKESSSPFLGDNGLSEDNSNSQSAAVVGDHKIEDIKNRQSDKLHMGLLMENDIGRLQIVKNSDLEELRELGSGTFGTVYHGKWRGSDVAIKRINDRCFAGKPSEQEKMRADFWNEASKLADLHHPNVVAFYGVVIDGPDGSFATVTEYMVNGSLRSALQRNDKTLDQWQRLLIAMDVAFGMEYLHGKNIVHFDLKSDNLLVNLRDPQRPICKVGDLGLSKVKCKTLISGGVRGTLPWMAPELLSGSSNLVSEKVDVFSFGIVMWELLTGEEPYSDLHYGAIIGGIVSNTLRPAVPDSCDPEWGALMEQCWSAEPTDRPSFTEIAKRLRSMAASLPQKGQAQK